MSAVQNQIDSFIERTLSAEENEAIQAVEKAENDYRTMLAQLHEKLNAALEADDSKLAAKVAYEILQHEPSNEDIDSLHGFLLQRIGVNLREPIFASLIHPNITTVSAISLLLPATLLAINQLDTDSDPDQIGVTSCLLLGFILALPLFDAGIAWGYNHLNRWRIISE